MGKFLLFHQVQEGKNYNVLDPNWTVDGSSNNLLGWIILFKSGELPIEVGKLHFELSGAEKQT